MYLKKIIVVKGQLDKRVIDVIAKKKKKKTYCIMIDVKPIQKNTQNSAGTHSGQEASSLDIVI